LSYRDFLHALYNAAKASLPRYSYVQFAEDVGFPKSNALHLILNGKRRLTKSGTAKVVAALELRGVERQFFETLVAMNNAKDSGTKERAAKKLESLKSRSLASPLAERQLEYFAKWYHPVIREMLSVPGADQKAETIAKRIEPKVSVQDIKDSIKLLKKLDLVRWDKAAHRYVLPTEDVATSEEVYELGLFLYLKSVTELGTDALMRLPEHRRDMSAVTIAGSEATLQKIKAEVAAFHERLLAISREAPSSEHVYQVNIQVFPFTR